MLLLDISDMMGAGLEMVIILLITALLAGIIGWLLHYQLKYKKLQEEHETLQEAYGSLENERNGLVADLDSANGRITNLEASLADCRARRETLENEATELRPFKIKYNDLWPIHQQKLALIGTLETDVEDGKARERAKDGALKDCLKGRRTLEDKNDSLQAEINRLTAALATTKTSNKKQKETEEEILARIKKNAEEKVAFDHIGIVTADMKDNLQTVKGIGPFIERKLNSIGIYTFAQIARFRPEDEESVNEVIEFFPGRIKRDNWAGQAKKLAEEKKKEEDK